MPIPTNNETINSTSPSTPVFKIELLPSPSFVFEEHLNTAIDMEARRFRYVMDWAFGKGILVDAGTALDDTFVIDSGGDIYVKEFKLISGYYLIQSFSSQKANVTSSVPVGTTFVLLTITENIETYESNPNLIGVSYNAQTQSGPNQYRYSAAVSLVSAIPTDVPNSPYTYNPLTANSYPDGLFFPSRAGNSKRYLQLATVVKDSSGIITVSQSLRRVLRVGDFLTEEFKADWESLKRLNVASPPEAVRNFRIVDIQPYSSAHDNVAAVTLSWNWSDCQGVGGLGQFTVNSVSAGSESCLKEFDGSGNRINVANNALIGWKLWIPNNSTFYTITGNTVVSGNTVLTVTTSDGSTPDLSSIVVSGSNYAVVTQDNDSYQISGVRYNDAGSVPVDTNRLAQSVWYKPSPTSPVVTSVTLQISLGYPSTVVPKYKFYVQAVLGNQKSNHEAMNPGKYYPGISVSKQDYYTSGFTGISYGVVASISMPSVKTGSASISATPNSYGFLVTINPGSGPTDGWTLASDYEIAYTTDSSGASFTNPNHIIRRTNKQLLYQVNTTVNGTYYVAVRALMAGSSVTATPLTDSCQAGSGGALVYDTTVGPFTVLQQTYSGIVSSITNPVSFSVFSGTSWTVNLSSIVYPAGGTISVSTLPDVAGETLYMTSQDLEYEILSSIGANSLRVSSLGLVAPGTSGAFQIGVSTSGRYIYQAGPFEYDFDIVRISSDIWTIDSNGTAAQVSLGVYQPARGQSSAQYHLVGSPGRSYTDTNYQVRRSYGEALLYLTSYSPTSDASNKICFNGTVTLFIRAVGSVGQTVLPGGAVTV